MSDILFIILCIVLLVLLGIIVVLLTLNFLGNGKDRQLKRKEIPEVYNSPTAVGRYWHLELWNATTNRLYTKDFCGQVMIGRSTAMTEPFWQMRVGEDRTISKEQCVVYDRSGFLVVENISQVNITMLNGYPITMPMLLQEGCQILMGNNVFYVSRIQRAA